MISHFFPGHDYQIVDPKWMISHFFPGCEMNGDCGFKMDESPFFSRTSYHWRLWIRNGRFPIFFPDATSVAIVDPKWTISLFFCRTLHQWWLWIQNGRFPFFFPGGEINGDRIVDPKWTVSHFFLGRDSSGDCGSKMDDFPFFSRTRNQWRLWIQIGWFPIFFPGAIISMAIVDPKWMISHFFPRRDNINGDCESNIDDFPFFSRTRYQWRLWNQSPTWTVSDFFPWRDINGDCGSKVGDFPFSRTRYQWRLWIQNPKLTNSDFFPDATSMAIVDPKWKISRFFPGREIRDDCGSKVGDFPLFPGREINVFIFFAFFRCSFLDFQEFRFSFIDSVLWAGGGGTSPPHLPRSSHYHY